MNRITFSEIAWKDYLDWQSEDKKTVEKINSLLKSIGREGPMKGEGKPERLKHSSKEYSRRINRYDRLVYEVKDNEILVKSCRGHYED